MKKTSFLVTICFMIILLLGFTIIPDFYSDNYEEPVSDGDTLIDHHTHIFSPEVRKYLEENVEGVNDLPPLGIEQLKKTMERDNVDKAVILSNAYFFSDSGGVSGDQFKTLQSENDCVAKAVSRYPDKLVGFFSINPLSDSAFVEIERNAIRNKFAGIKLHFANSGVDLRNQHHVKRLGNIFKAANSYDLGIVVHMRTTDESYGQQDARIFVDKILSQAPKIPIQIAHMAGWSGYDEATDQALGVFADYIAKGELRDGVYFDLSAVIKPVPESKKDDDKEAESQWYPQQRYERLTERLRTIGMERILFGTDWPEWMPANYKSDIEKKLPLTESELQVIFSNRAPWVR